MKRGGPRLMASSQATADTQVLQEIETRVLWLSTRIVDAANRERPNSDGVKVGGHQASSASLVSVMTALWFAYLNAEDRVSVKPHASPVLHAIQYLMGDLDRRYLTQLRARGGLQSYPSRTKDPDRVDFSTGSVGLGAAAPLFAAAARRYVDAHFGDRKRSRFIALIGDAELDEGNVWEAVAEPATSGLGNVCWIVDFNRQSLDRVVPGTRIAQWRDQFVAAGWHEQEVKYGSRLRSAFRRRGGKQLHQWIELMSNEQYQSLFGAEPDEVRKLFLDGAPKEVESFCAALTDVELAALVTDLGGHDLPSILEALGRADRVTDKPSIVFAYTIKGWGLPIAGNPRNHSALLTPAQLATVREAAALDEAGEWDRFEADSPAGRWCKERHDHLRLEPAPSRIQAEVPVAVGVRTGKKPISSQEAFGRVLVDLSRDEQLGRYLVTAAPDVATSTNLAGLINRLGVFSPTERRAWSSDPLLKWVESPRGQHIELGISEMNLFLLLGQLGLAGDLSSQPLLPVGTVYDPFVLRGLDAFIYSVYSGSRFIVAGTPSGVTLAPEGGAHQSTITASVGLELPNVTFLEPAYAGALDWLMCDAMLGLATDAPGAYYFRLSTRPLDQGPFNDARERLGEQVLRDQVLSGAYRLLDASDLARDGAPVVHLAASGAVIPEVLQAAGQLHQEGVAAHVTDITSLGRLYNSWTRDVRAAVRSATTLPEATPLRATFPEHAPVVTVHDAASHTMAWIGSGLGVPGVSLGVDSFGQSGSVRELYELFDLVPEAIVNAALTVLQA